MLIHSPSITVSKTSFFSVPLLVALLITCLLHFVFILWLHQLFHKQTQPKNTIAITLIKTKSATQLPVKNLQKPAVIAKNQPQMPVAKPKKQVYPASLANLPKVKAVKKWQMPVAPIQTSSAVAENSPTATEIVPKQAVIEPVIADKTAVEPVVLTPNQSDTAPVAPIKPIEKPTEPVIAEPVSVTKVETEAVTANPVPAVNKPIESVKTAEVSEPVQPDSVDKPASFSTPADKKITKKSSSKTEVIPTELSMDDLAAQIAQVGKKFGNPVPSATESRIKPLNSVRHHKTSARQYKQDWRYKIEQIANRNYPEAARQKDFFARLVLEVGINADGSIHSVRVKKSSGTPALDQAAKNIIQMGAPFAALPKDLAEEVDVLILQQPMQFSDESGVSIQ